MRGINTWHIERDGVYYTGSWYTEEDAQRELASYDTREGFTVAEAKSFNATDFNVSITNKIDATPEPRLGDDNDMAQPLDELIATLFEQGVTESNVVAKCHRLLESLHGSTVANEWYDRVIWDWDNNKYIVKSPKKFKVVAFTRHEFYVDADWSGAAESAAEAYLSFYPAVFVDADKTAYIVKEVE